MDNQKLSIRININERFYPLKIKLKDEEKIRKAAKNINELIAKYKKIFKDSDGQDLLAMVSLQLGIKSIELDNQEDLSEIIGDIRGINRNIETLIESKDVLLK